MIQTINDLYTLAAKQPKRKLALAAAEDQHALEAAYSAAQKNIIELILVGDSQKILNIANEKNLAISANDIIHEPNKELAVKKAVELVAKGEADILMKGNVPTATLLKGVLNKENGLRKSKVLSHFSLFEIKAYHKLLALTDVAMNIDPDFQTKVHILNNAVQFMNDIGIQNPKVAPLAAVEVVNPAMQATLDAALLTQMNHRGQIKNCIVDGPLAFDNAISKESAKHKGIKSEVAGDADLLLFPNLEAGNVIYKSLSYFASAKLAAVILGAKAPIVLTSRSDSEEAKLNSILLAALK